MESKNSQGGCPDNFYIEQEIPVISAPVAFDGELVDCVDCCVSLYTILDSALRVRYEYIEERDKRKRFVEVATELSQALKQKPTALRWCNHDGRSSSNPNLGIEYIDDYVSPDYSEFFSCSTTSPFSTNLRILVPYDEIVHFVVENWDIHIGLKIGEMYSKQLVQKVAKINERLEETSKNFDYYAEKSIKASTQQQETIDSLHKELEDQMAVQASSCQASQAEADRLRTELDQALQKTPAPPEFDKVSLTYPPELALALDAWRAVSTSEGKGKPKARILAWLNRNTRLSEKAKDRIAVVCNWEKLGGATRSE